MESGVVYKFVGNDCSRSYIGQTNQWLKARIIGYSSDCRMRLRRLFYQSIKEENFAGDVLYKWGSEPYK